MYKLCMRLALSRERGRMKQHEHDQSVEEGIVKAGNEQLITLFSHTPPSRFHCFDIHLCPYSETAP